MQKYEINIPEEKIQTLIESLLKGTPINYACDKAMIPMFYIYRWRKSYDELLAKMENGEEVDKSIFEPPLDKNGVLVYKKLNTITISAIIKNARATWLEELVENLKTDSGNWQKWAWLLERCFKDVFAKDEIQNPTKQIESIKVVYVNPEKEKKRLETLENEVKENVQ